MTINEIEKIENEIERLEKENAELLKVCEKKFVFDTTENTYSIFEIVRKEFAKRLKEKLNNVLNGWAYTSYVDELLKEYE